MRYAISALGASGTHGLDTAGAREMRFREQVRQWAEKRVAYIQLREKQLAAGELLALTSAGMAVLAEVAGQQQGRQQRGEGAPPTRLLVNGRADVAVAAGADGVHLSARPGELVPEQVRSLYAGTGLPRPIVSVSCHSLPEVRRACEGGADLVLFGPVFEKRVAGEVVVGGVGLDALREACAAAGATPVLALGGVTDETLPACLAVGAAGVAGIRLFT